MVASEFKGVDLDGDLDDIDDLPEFKTFPSGSYLITLAKGLVEKPVNNHPAMECEMTLTEVMEITEVLDAGKEEPPKIGDTCTTVFMLDNSTGAGKLKEFLVPIREKLGKMSTRQLALACRGMQLLVVLHRTFDSKKDRHYSNIKKVAVV